MSTTCDNELLDLDLHYSPSKWNKRMDPSEVERHYVEVCTKESKTIRNGSTKRDLHVEYGTGEREKVDIYYPANIQKDAPVLLFIHGGYWQTEEISKDNSAVLVPPLVKHGVIVVVVGYSLAPKTSVSSMVQQVQQAVMFVARKFPESRGIYISGHSAGGHLAAMMLNYDWSSQPDIPKHIIKGVCPMSGVYDIRPIVKTYVNGPLSLTQSTAASISPVLLVDQIPEDNLRILVRLTSAEHNPPVFHEQMATYCKLLCNRGMDVTAEVLPGKDHFDEILTMVQEENVLQKVLFKMMNLT